MTAPLIDIDNLAVRRNGKTICSVPSLTVQRGDRVAVLGQNGSGKTTLLRILAGFENDFDGACRNQVARKQRVFVDQNPYLFRGTVMSNVMYGLRAHGHPRRSAKRLAAACLEQFDAARLHDAKAHHLSAGERRRTALARAVVINPQLLLLDEPLADMDDQGAAAVRNALAELSNTTILLSSPITLPAGLTTSEFRLSA